MKRRELVLGAGPALVGIGALGSGLVGGARPLRAETPLGEAGPSDRVLGDPEAPVTVVEYASMTCPHCAAFHSDTLPKLKEEWIETGKAKLVYRHYPLDQLALRAALLADCFEGDRFFAMLDMLFKQQGRWARAEEPLQHLARLAGMAGLSQERFEACMTDEARRDAILEEQLRARDEAGVQSTPSFLIDGEMMAGNQGYESFAKRLRAAL